MKRVIISGLLVSFGLLVGRLSGFVREAIVASEFGATEQADLIIVFLSAPDVLVNLLVAGALGMALIPEFNRLGKTTSVLLYQQVNMLIIVVFLIISAVSFLFSSELLLVFAPGLDDELVTRYSTTFGFSFIALPLTVLAGVTTAYLHSEYKFLVPALGTLIFNLGLILGLYFAGNTHGDNLLKIVSLSIICASLIRWLTQVINSKVLPFNAFSITNNLLSKELIKRYIFCVLTGGILFLMPVVARSIASLNGPGELSLVNYAIKLVELPLGVVLTVFATVFFPKFSEYFSNRNEIKFLKTFQQILLCVIAISMSVFLPLQLLSASIALIVYDWGGLSSFQLARIGDYFSQVSITLPFQGVNALLLAVIAARRDTVSPFIITTILAVSFVMIGYLFVESINGIFLLMINIYMLLSLILLSIIYLKHRVHFFDVSFCLDFLKIMIFSIAYYNVLIFIENEQRNIWLDMIIVSITSIFFLIMCLCACKNMRQIVRVKKGGNV